MDKYFTPDKEDLRIGYECEIWWNYNYLPVNEWCKVRVLESDTKDFDMYDFTERIPKNEIRTPFLTREEIEACGWTCIDDNERTFIRNKIVIQFDFQKHSAIIGDDLGPNIYFKGECKDVNTLRYITKLLGI